jgi:tyrosyl-tRNA synthetase
MNPRDAKIDLGREIVTRYHDAEQASAAEAAWLAQFSQRQVPQDMPERELTLDEDAVWVPKLLSDLGLVKSSSEGRRRIQQGGVEVDGDRLSDPQAKLPKGRRYVIKAGKRSWVAVTLK